MATLIKHDQRCWDFVLIYPIFMPWEVAQIRQIPLSWRWPRDSLIWGGFNRGVFSVRSAYRILYNQHRSGEASTSSESADVHSWFSNRLWSVKVNFIWRTCRNILPTQTTTLFDKNISSSFSCQWYKDEPETGNHVLWGCEFAQRVWCECPVLFRPTADSRMSFMDFLGLCLRDLSSP